MSYEDIEKALVAEEEREFELEATPEEFDSFRHGAVYRDLMHTIRRRRDALMLSATDFNTCSEGGRMLTEKIAYMQGQITALEAMLVLTDAIIEDINLKKEEESDGKQSGN